MKINNIQPNQSQNFKARLVKTPALDVLLDKISTDYSRRGAAKLCKNLRKLKPDDIEIKIPEFISNPMGRSIVIEVSKKNKAVSSHFLPISASRIEIISPGKIFKSIKKMTNLV